MSKHTPGPWVAVHHKLSSSVQLDAEYGLVDVIDHPSITRETNIRNAQLIAAAPELLEALRDLVLVVSHGDDASIVIGQAKTAIDTAQGSTQ